MASVTGVFVSSILPVVALVTVGFLLEQRVGLDAGPLNTLTLYVLTPALIFHSLSLTALRLDALFRVTVGVVVFVGAMVAIGWLYGTGTGKEESVLSGFLLIVTFGNTGGLGIPMADFAFGGVGRETAVLFAAIHGAFVFTLGLYLASLSGGASGLGSLKRVLKYPLVYAVALAVGARALGIVPPADSVTMETVGLVGDSAIPVMLFILGIQLARTSYASALSMTVTPTLFRFVLSPLVGTAVVRALGFQNPTVARVFVLLTAMPVAIAPVIFVVEFADDTLIGGVTTPEFVSASVFVTTLVSVPVLTAAVTILKSGAVV